MKKILDRFYRLPREAHFLLAVCLFVTIMFVFMYAVAQNVLRSGANDPQIQMAEDAAFLLQNQTPMGPIVPEKTVEVSQSLAPFIQVYDKKGSLLDANVMLHGKSFTISKEALNYAKDYGENRLTWQPEKGVRIAAVISHYDGQNPGFVVAGKSLRETENRIGNIGKLCFLAWVGMMIVLGGFYYFFTKKIS